MVNLLNCIRRIFLFLNKIYNTNIVQNYKGTTLPTKTLGEKIIFVVSKTKRFLESFVWMAVQFTYFIHTRDDSG